LESGISGQEPKSGSFLPERWLFISGTLALLDRNAGPSRPDYACKAITTSSLIEKLCELEEAPWSTLHRGEPINPRGLGRILRPFGIVSANLKISRDPVTGKDTVAKGYKRETFIDAWMRYLPLPATNEEKGREIQANRENGKVAVADGHPLPGSTPGDEVADKCRYRYPSATEKEEENVAFSAEIPSDGAGGSGVAGKKETQR
jgi:hypothetical protein